MSMTIDLYIMLPGDSLLLSPKQDVTPQAKQLSQWRHIAIPPISPLVKQANR